MKTPLIVLASVLLAGASVVQVAASDRHGARAQGENQRWTKFQQRNNRDQPGWDDFANSREINGQYNDNDNRFENVAQFNRRQNDDGRLRLAGENAAELNRQRNNNKYESSNEHSSNGQRQQYNRKHQLAASGITKTIVDKIAALQKIAVDCLSEKKSYMNRDLEINKNAIKLPGHHFVTFYNATMKNLDAGQLETLYMNYDRDTVYVQYKFDQLKTVGSFKSNDPHYKSGYFTILLNHVNSTVKTGFNHNQQQSPMESAEFTDADAIIVTENGTEIKVFDDALEHRYLRVLGNAVTNELLLSTSHGMVGQLKGELSKSMAAQSNAGTEDKLFDMKWTEDDVTMEMLNVGLGGSAATAGHRLYNTVNFQRKFENAYTMRYLYVLADLEWSSALTIESAGIRMSTRPVNFKIKKIDLFVTFFKSLDQQQQNGSCLEVDAEVDVTGLRYNFDDETAVQPNLLALAKNRLQRFMEQSLELHFQNSMKQAICGRNNNNQ